MSLRVLHVVHDYLPRHQAGSELYVAALCAALARAGHHPIVFAATFAPGKPHGSLDWRLHADVPVVEVVNNWEAKDFAAIYDGDGLAAAVTLVLDAARPHVVHVHNLLNLSLDLPARVKTRGIPVVATLHDYTLVCPSGGQRVHRADAHLCTTIEPARCARCFAASPFHAQWRLGQVARRAPGRTVGRLAAALSRRLPGAAAAARDAVGAVAGPPVTSADIDARLAAARKAFAEFDAVVAPSASMADEYRRLGFAADRIEVADYGFAPLKAAPRLPAADGRLRIGFTGTLVWHKGVDVLIEAVRALPHDRVDVRIFGDETVFPEYTQKLRGRARGLPVSFMGPYAHADIAGVLAQLDVLVVPSRWLENSPLVIHEAFMARVPVVASAIGGMPDLLGGGRHGVLVPPDDAGALGAALLALLDEPGRLAAFTAGSPSVTSIDDDAAKWVARYRAAMQRGADLVPAS